MWRDLAWVLDMLQASRKTIEYARGLSEEQFRVSGLHQDAILRQLTIVGEAAKRVSTEFRVSHPEFLGDKLQGSAMSSFMIMPEWTCRKFGVSSRRTDQQW
jgi:uncharacterized protein with HEPN domain